jgi:hypothetical protein
MRLSVTILLTCAAICRASEPAEARWEGSILIPGRELSVVIDLAQDASGKWIGSAILPGFSVKGAPLSDIAVNGVEVSFAIKEALAGPSFQGRVDRETLAGEFQQSGNRAPFRLQKIGPPQVDPPRTGTAVSKELEGEWQGEFLVNGNKVNAILKLENHAGAPATAQFRVVGKRETNLPVDRVTLEGEWLTVRASEFQIAYQGQFRGGEIGGVFKQGPFESTLVLRRAGAR